jgi:Zn-finger nucleic acid-binding protein
MECPKCNAAMAKVTFGSIEVDRCTQCGGIWFEPLEKDQLKSLKKSEEIDTGDPKTGKEYNKIDHIDCPVCGAQMLRMVDARQPHIWYEGCPICYGVFFDAGEFTDYKTETLTDFFKDLMTPERE